MRSLVAAVAVLLVATAVIDLLAGRTTLSDEMPGLGAVLGWLLLRELAALTRWRGRWPPNLRAVADLSADQSRRCTDVGRTRSGGLRGIRPKIPAEAGADGSNGKPEHGQALNG